MKNSLQITSQKNIVLTLILLCGVWRDITVMFISASLTRWKSSFGSLVGLGLKSAYASLWVWGCLTASFVLASQIILQKKNVFCFQCVCSRGLIVSGTNNPVRTLLAQSYELIVAIYAVECKSFRPSSNIRFMPQLPKHWLNTFYVSVMMNSRESSSFLINIFLMQN